MPKRRATERHRAGPRPGSDTQGRSARAQVRAEQRARRLAAERRWRRRTLTTYGLVMVLLAGMTAYLGSGGEILSGFLPDGPGLPTSLLDDPHSAAIAELSAEDIQQMNRQREIIDELARRHVGVTPSGSLDDIRILQEILNARALDKDQTLELQALGVVLGDVMVQNLGLEWVVVNDQYGRSRALRDGDGSDLVFPVTLISKRVELGYTIYVDALYDKIAATVRGFRRR